MRVAGADVWKGRWVVVVLNNLRFERAFIAADIATVVTELDDCVAIGVDMPIGLPPAGVPRPADSEARKFVGPRSSSVFPTPSAELLECASAADANLLAKQRGWSGISAQGFALKKQILALKPLAEADRRIWEVHPEVSFAEASTSMGGGQLEWSKSSWNGTVQRLGILKRQGITLPDDLGPAGAAGAPDVLDATIAAWSADRIAWGAEESFPARADRIGAIWR